MLLRLHTSFGPELPGFVKVVYLGIVLISIQKKVNCVNQLHANVPFGGYKQSGIGRELGEDVLRKYVNDVFGVFRL